MKPTTFKNGAFILLIFALNTLVCNAQSQFDFKKNFDLLIQNCDSSQQISSSEYFKNIIKNQNECTSSLIALFGSSTETSIYSDCLGKNLSQGEVAIIVIDYILDIPYFQVTGLQNCTLQSCPNNPNKIEFYLKWTIIHDINHFITNFNRWYESK